MTDPFLQTPFFQGAELTDHGERRAERILQAGLEHFGDPKGNDGTFGLD